MQVKGWITEAGDRTDEVDIRGTWDGILTAAWRDGKEETLVEYKTFGPPTKNK